MIPRTDERPNTIALKWNGHAEEGRAKVDGILPGYLIELATDETDVPRLPATVQVHSAQGVKPRIRIAKEDRLGNVQGSIEGRTIDTPYEEGDIVPYVELVPGDVFLGRVAPQYTAVIGTELTSAGDGTFEAVGGGDVALVEIEETIDFSDVEGSDEPLVRMRVI